MHPLRSYATTGEQSLRTSAMHRQCTVHIGGGRAFSCITAVSDAVGKEVTTIEGLSNDNSRPLQLAWIEEDVPQCGCCQSGQIMAAASLNQRGHVGA